MAEKSVKMIFPHHSVNINVVDNDENYLNIKTSFLEKLLIKNVQKWVNMSFPDHSVNRKVVENVENYLNMQFLPKLKTHSREKPIF